MEEYVTIKKEDFDLLISKANKYDAGGLNDDTYKEYLKLKENSDNECKRMMNDVKLTLHIIKTLEYISDNIRNNKEFISAFEFDSLSFLIRQLIRIPKDFVNINNYNYDNINGVKDEIVSIKEYISNKLFMTKENKNKICKLLDALFYLSIKNVEEVKTIKEQENE